MAFDHELLCIENLALALAPLAKLLYKLSFPPTSENCLGVK